MPASECDSNPGRQFPYFTISSAATLMFALGRCVSSETPNGFSRLGLRLETGTFPRTKVETEPMSENSSRWRTQGVEKSSVQRVGRCDRPDARYAAARAVTTEATRATKLSAGAAHHRRQREDRAHHHRDLESVIYVVSRLARLRWGERLEFVAEAEPGTSSTFPPTSGDRR